MSNDLDKFREILDSKKKDYGDRKSPKKSFSELKSEYKHGRFSQGYPLNESVVTQLGYADEMLKKSDSLLGITGALNIYETLDRNKPSVRAKVLRKLKDIPYNDFERNPILRKQIENFLKGEKMKSGLEDIFGNSKLSIISICAGIFGIFFLSPNITGNTIGSLNQINSNWIGGGLLLLGLIAFYFSCKCK